MPSTPETVQIFNLKTMSGVFPGARTQVFQRLRLQSNLTGATANDPSGATLVWTHLRWYDDPAACVLFAASDEDGAQTPLLRIENPQKETIVSQLEEALSPGGRRPLCCGGCRFLAPAPAQTPDGFPSGRCQWQTTHPADERTAPEDAAFIEHQSVLALGCDHWAPRQHPLEMNVDVDAAAQPLPPMPKAAEFSAVATKASMPSRWQRLQVFVMQLFKRSKDKSDGATAAPPLAALVERSGVGAGTEPCFVCQGRLANLSALVVESITGDKQTYSLWRCRNCYSYFVSDWVDRWERLDSLETEEHHYRLAPAEAQSVLQQSRQHKGSDHPAGREQRTEQRIWFEQLLHARQPLSHQIKLGR